MIKIETLAIDEVLDKSDKFIKDYTDKFSSQLHENIQIVLNSVRVPSSKYDTYFHNNHTYDILSSPLVGFSVPVKTSSLYKNLELEYLINDQRLLVINYKYFKDPDLYKKVEKSLIKKLRKLSSTTVTVSSKNHKNYITMAASVIQALQNSSYFDSELKISRIFINPKSIYHSLLSSTGISLSDEVEYLVNKGAISSDGIFDKVYFTNSISIIELTGTNGITSYLTLDELRYYNYSENNDTFIYESLINSVVRRKEFLK